MAKQAKTIFLCGECGYESGKWLGKCPACGSWNTLVEAKALTPQPGSPAWGGPAALPLREVAAEGARRFSTGIGELDRVLGTSPDGTGGVVAGSTILLGGDPGIGKSTLLMQAAASLAERATVLYVTGEESAAQLKLRAERLGVGGDMFLLAETDLGRIESEVKRINPAFLIIDSIQTMYCPEGNGVTGSVSQVRESTALLTRLAKCSGCTVFIVGHVTKEGAIAGPRILEHMVDTVLYFEGDRHDAFRLLRAVKNRFGSVNELGVFRMTGKGMQVVENPSEELLSHRAKGASGSTVFCGLEGSRPLLCDVQALTSPSFNVTPRRSVNGADNGRVAMLLAVLEKRAYQRTYNQDVYINVAGGLELSEPAADLALCVAVASSLKDKATAPEIAVMGEVGLAGEVRTVPQCERRISECARLGFTTIIVPRANAGRIRAPEGVRIIGVDTVAQALSVIF